MLPDVDVIAFRFGVPYAAEMGHRGFTHSLAFAALVSLIGAASHRVLETRLRTAFLFLLAATASHAILDAFTDGGLGVALLWPFSSERYFAPFRPIHVAPLRLTRLLSGRGAAVLVSELRTVWLPSVVVGMGLAARTSDAKGSRGEQMSCTGAAKRCRNEVGRAVAKKKGELGGHRLSPAAPAFGRKAGGGDRSRCQGRLPCHHRPHKGR